MNRWDMNTHNRGSVDNVAGLEIYGLEFWRNYWNKMSDLDFVDHDGGALIRRTMIPTPTGPTTVHTTTAQTMTRKISSPEGCVIVSSRCFNVKVPELCDSEAIRKPISPRATMAKPTSNAIEWGGPVESSIAGSSGLGFAVGNGLDRICSGLCWEEVFFLRHRRTSFFSFQILMKYSKYRTEVTKPLAMIMRIE